MGCRLPTTALLRVLPSPSPSSIAASSWRRRRGLRGARPRLLLHPLPAASSTASASSSSPSYNGWGELAAAPDLSSFPLPNGLILLLLLLLPASASALALSRLPPLPLLVAAFTAGFAARHLSSPQAQAASTPRRLTLVLADLDARLRDLRETTDADADAVGRLHDAVLEAIRLANHNTTSCLGDLTDSFAAWAWDTMRDLLTSKPKVAAAVDPAAVHSPKVVSNSHTDAAAAAQAQLDPPVHATRAHSLQDMLPFDHHDDDDADAHGLEDVGTTNLEEDGPLERLLLKHRQNHHFRGRFATDSSFLHKRKLEIRDRSYSLKIESESQVSQAQERLDDLFSTAMLDPDIAATDSDCDEFSRNVKEAAQTLKKARECMMAGAHEETADALLYKSARLLSAAVALRPTSLVAVGQLGNTYLLHGELKLKISRELRTLLANSDALLNGRERVPRSSKVDRRILSRGNISTALVDVCEECESLLVEAGRSYRTALSIDSGDVKALYNWGLALIFRAQLLADIGPEAAVDADQVYLAAIDKFDAMLSKSNTYAPEALYRWGTALQQRSHLRPRNNKEKIRLLEQAKSLFEDVLYVEADNKMVREALSSCISELNYHGRWI